MLWRVQHCYVPGQVVLKARRFLLKNSPSTITFATPAALEKSSLVTSKELCWGGDLPDHNVRVAYLIEIDILDEAFETFGDVNELRIEN